MLNFFDGVVNFFASIWQFIENIVVNTLNLMKFIITMPQMVNVIGGYLPGIINTCVLLILGIGIMKLVLGWGNS